MNNLPTPFASKLAPMFLKLIKQEKSFGYKTTNFYYQKLDAFLVEQKLNEIALPQTMVELWIRRRDSEAIRTLGSRVTAVRVFAEYLIRQGIPAYYLPKYSMPRIVRNFVPYIFTHEEIARVFQAADNLAQTRSDWHLAYYPCLIRLLYSTGIRKGEAEALHWRNVDLEKGVLTIRQGKNRKDRLVPFSGQMLKHLKRHASMQGEKCRDEDFVFPAKSGKRVHRSGFGNTFRYDILPKAGIKHGGTGKGPRLHDLRHTFAVHNLEKWLNTGEDIQARLPVLADYLGHKKLSGTQMYLRLTPTMFPEIASRMEENVGKLIRNYENETD